MFYTGKNKNVTSLIIRYLMMKMPLNKSKFTEIIRSFSRILEIKLHFLDNSLFISLLLLYNSACLRLVCCCWATVMMHKSDLMVTLVYY